MVACVEVTINIHSLWNILPEEKPEKKILCHARIAVYDYHSILGVHTLYLIIVTTYKHDVFSFQFFIMTRMMGKNVKSPCSKIQGKQDLDLQQH